MKLIYPSPFVIRFVSQALLNADLNNGICCVIAVQEDDFTTYRHNPEFCGDPTANLIDLALLDEILNIAFQSPANQHLYQKTNSSTAARFECELIEAVVTAYRQIKLSAALPEVQSLNALLGQKVNQVKN